MPQQHSAQFSADIPTLRGLPRRRPEPASPPAKHAKEAIDDLHRLRPLIRLGPDMEATLLRGDELTRAKCLGWLYILRQFFELPDGLKALPPISFLNLLIDWIDGHARAERRKRKGLGWRWAALRGFVHDDRRLQNAKLLNNISRLTKSIAAHFSKAPFDHPLFILLEDLRRWHLRSDDSAFGEPGPIEAEDKAARVFAVLKRVMKDGKVESGDYSTLEPYVSKKFREPVVIKTIKKLHWLGDNERASLNEFLTRVAALNVYVQYRGIVDEVSSNRYYVKKVTAWLMQLGEPEAQSQFKAFYSRFYGSPPVNLERRPKKNVRGSGPV